MAKYELVKETTINGIVRYSIEKDGTYVINSCSQDLFKVEEYLKNILENGEKEKIKQIIKTIEINEDQTN